MFDMLISSNPVIIILSLFIALLTYFANKSYTASLQYEHEYSKYANSKTLENNIKNETTQLITNLFSVLLNDKKINKINNIDNEMQMINKYEHIIQTNLQYFVIVLLLSLFTLFIFSKTIVLTYLYIVSLGSLFLGLISPIFLMYVTQTLANSEVILQFESSTIVSSIEKLFLQDNYFVGGIILLFSIVFPILKTLISFLALVLSNAKVFNILSNLSSKVTKFSMTDVFVLSIFLVYLSPKADGMIKTQLEVGFYFFFIYVILSILTSLLNNKKTNN